MKTIPLTQGKLALVDDEDFERLNRHTWCASYQGRTFYVVRYATNKHIRMHRELLDPPKELEIDHIDGNGLNNQKSNLRIVTTRENSQNRHQPKTSRFPGVNWHKRDKKWRVQIQVYGKRKDLGLFDTEEEAHQTYQNAVTKIRR